MYDEPIPYMSTALLVFNLASLCGMDFVQQVPLHLLGAEMSISAYGY
jgi:hypothetical protein